LMTTSTAGSTAGCASGFAAGTLVTLVATTVNGYSLSRWAGNVCIGMSMS
jgi:phage tail tape-measure protein